MYILSRIEGFDVGDGDVPTDIHGNEAEPMSNHLEPQTSPCYVGLVVELVLEPHWRGRARVLQLVDCQENRTLFGLAVR
jgi:hypothetical protein